MKYIEELKNGETFQTKNQYWLMTSDFKNNGNRLCYNLNEGYPKWFEANEVVDVSPIYILDKDNNILPIKNYTNENSSFS